MKIADFALERYFAKWEFAVRHVLAASDVEALALTELLDLADDDGRRRFESLTLGYTESLGLPVLRETIANLYRGVDASHIITFAGAEEGIFVAMHALLSPGDHVVAAWPAYQSLYEVARSIGAEVTLVALSPRDWSLDVDAIAGAMRPNTRAIVVNSPHSPTGAQIPADQFERLLNVADLHGAHLFSDEVYRFMEHSAPRLPAAVECSERGISLGVMSKAFGLAGLRVGWIATCDLELYNKLARLKDYTTICNAAPSEILSLIGLRAKDVILERTHRIISDNLRILDEFFVNNNDRFAWVRPCAGSVAFPKLVAGDVDQFAAGLVENEGVLILPASRFGYSGNHFRIGYGRRDMAEGLARMEAYAKRVL